VIHRHQFVDAAQMHADLRPVRQPQPGPAPPELFDRLRIELIVLKGLRRVHAAEKCILHGFSV